MLAKDNVILRSNGKKIFLAVLIAAGIILFFWGQSRIPALTEKAQMGQRTTVGTLAFDIVLPVAAADPAYQRIIYTAVNWAYTNWKGMTFGVFFAAAFLSLLNYFPRHAFNNRFLNTLKGVVTGAPLGVCANCATPIAHGMYQAGVRIETVVATLTSSPTLNIIVLTMSFSLLPFHIATAKLIAVLLFIGLVIPLLARLDHQRLAPAVHDQVEDKLQHSFFRHSVIDEHRETSIEMARDDRTWLAAASAVLRDYLRALALIFRTTVPFMALAGLLGAAVVELVPLEQLSGLHTSLLAVLAVAIVGTFLPVPIAFDVVVVSLLLGSGVPTLFSMTLLFTLGIFSVYPFFILSRHVSRQLALALFAVVALFGIASGYTVQAFEDWTSARVVAAYQESKQLQPPVAAEPMMDYPQQIAIATRICDQLDEPYQRQACIADFVFSQVSKGSGVELCDAWSDNNALREFCHTEYRQRTTMNEAQSKRDMSLCESLQPAQRKFACMELVISARLRAGEPLAMCEELANPQAVQWCKQQGIAIRLDKFNDTDACAAFDVAQLRDECYANARVLRLASGRRLENCDELDQAVQRSTCRRLVAFGMIDDGASAAICANLIEPGLLQDCRVHATIVNAAKQGDPEQCQQITGPQVDVCKRVAINQQIEMAIDRATMIHIQQALSAQPDVLGTVADSGLLVDSPGANLIQEHAFFVTPRISASYFEHAARVDSQQSFSRHSAAAFGIPDVWRFSLLEFRSPFIMGRGIASGDFNNDHWPDLVLASNDGIHLFRNTGNGQFVRQPIAAHAAVPRDTYVTAFADLDNDGWQDILVTGYGGDALILFNDGAGFKTNRTVRVRNGDAILAVSAGFADVDRDGDLDIFLGNWSFGEDKAFLENYSGNRFLINSVDGFQAIKLNEIRGDSLSVLFSDLNDDGAVDLAIGNDREIPDIYFQGTPDGTLRRIARADDWIPATTLNTMSIDSADFNNDLHLDIFSADMTFSKGIGQDYCELIVDRQAQTRCRLLLEGRDRIERRDVEWCQKLDEVRDRDECLTAMYRAVAIATQQRALCDSIPDHYAAHRQYCHNMARNDIREERFSVSQELAQVQRNVLLMADGAGGYRDATLDYGIAESFWTWNAKAADLDNDGWQDIYAANGFRFGEGEWEIHSNVFFHNQQGQGFIAAQQAFNLEDWINTPSYVQVDFDLDGDLDIFATGVLAPLRIYRNEESSHNSISFALRDDTANRFGIGSKVSIYYQDEGKTSHQVRELKASGGFMSFDHPVAHFGLGEQNTVSRVEIVWSTGEKSVFERTFPANRQYIIRRTSNSESNAE